MRWNKEKAILLLALTLGGTLYFLSSERESASVTALTSNSEGTNAEIVSEKYELKADVIIDSEVKLDVPLINQMTAPLLYNGCEVTSLAMILNYWGVAVTKNQLANALPSVAYHDGKYYGDPNVAFVGDITGNEAGYFVYHEPIYQLAQTFASDDLEVVDLTGATFSELQQYLSQGCPVWVITTTTFTKTNDMETWQTENGKVKISMSEHSVVLTGYDADNVYLNDPYGSKNYKTDLDEFAASWEQMGSQAIVITSE